MKDKKQITQETFDAAVEENISTFDMEREEAVEDAVRQFEAQGVDLSNLAIPGREQKKVEEESTQDGPHIKDNRDLFFQSDSDLRRQQEILASVNYDKGQAVKLPAKALCMQVSEEGIGYIGDAVCAIRTINTATGTPGMVFSGHKGPVSSLLIAGDVLITGSWDKTIRVWSRKSGVLVRTLEGHTDYVKALAIAGTTLYSGGSDKTLRLWDLTTGTLIKTLGNVHRRGIEGICVSEEDGAVYTACSDSFIRTIDTASAQCVATWEGHSTSVYALTLEEGYIYSGSADHTAKQWDPRQTKALRTYKHKDWVRAVTVWGSHLVTGSRDGGVRVWEVERESGCKEHSGHFDTVEGVQVVGGRRVVSAGLDGTLRRWDL